MNLKQCKNKGLALCCAIVSILMVNTAGASWAISAGTFSATGDYGKDQDTRIHMMPVSLSYAADGWRFKVSSGYLWLDGYRGITNAELHDANGQGCGCDTHDHDALVSLRESGVADTTLSAKYRFKPDKQSRVIVDVSAKFKIPTADSDKSLGTGKQDVGFRVGSYWRFPDWWGVLDLGYKFRGEPSNVKLNDTAQLIIGGFIPLNSANTMGLNMKIREASQEHKDPIRELQVFLNHTLDKQNRMTLLLVNGLSDSSPDWGLSTQWRYSF
ncbi:hypothetical protein A9Q99_25635 [Gammaproteobacteria bacterium 45_16_T64]|nr:hypothetical protein A9Q99_25635 [Gammaproteobacteria bacterium 45_16_T64]